MRPRSARSAAAASLLALAVSACGSGVPPKLAHEARPIWCPSGQKALLSRNPGTTQRISGSFGARVLLGKREAGAQRISARHGCGLRVINDGGALTADWNLRRIDVKIKHGVVTSAQVY